MPRARNLASCAETLEQGTQGTQGTQDTYCITQGTPRAHKGHRANSAHRAPKNSGAPCTGHPVSQAANLASCGQAIFQHGWALLLSSQFGLNWGTIGLLSDSGHPALSTGNLYPGWKLSLSLSLAFDMLYLDNLSES